MNTWLANNMNIGDRWCQLATNHAIMSSREYCKQMVPTCNKQMNFTTLCTDIQLILNWVIAKLQHQIQQEIVGGQITALKLKQSNLG